MPGNCGFSLSCHKLSATPASFNGFFAQISMILTSQPTAPRPTAILPRDLFIPTSGVGIMIHVFAETLGWATGYKKCGPVPGRNSLDDELDGCAMLMNNLSQWIDKRMRERQVLSGHSPAQCIFRRSALHPSGPLPSLPPPCLSVCERLGCARLWRYW